MIFNLYLHPDDQEDDDREADWLRLAGLSDLVMTSASTMMTSPSGRSVPSHVTNESLSSMTVLSTLTRPQREAVLRRITSFNRAQVNMYWQCFWRLILV